jgi:hypothetical protein
MTDRADSDPPRLEREVGPVANLIRRANTEFRSGLDEPRAFERLERVRRRRSLAGYVLPGALAAAAAFIVLGHRQDFGHEPSKFELVAELPRKAHATTPVQDVDVVPDPSAAHVAPAPPAPVGRRVPAVRSSSSSSYAAPSPLTEADCRKRSQEGKIERAEDCFRALARASSGVGAEVALYEAARLSAEALHEPLRALTLLDEHAKRFPGSALRGEVAWLTIRSLAHVGHFDAALQESEKLLGSSEGRALAEELHLLRGRIYQNEKKDCVQAVSEFVALVGAPGARGDEAEFRRAGCLEALGRVEDAVSAYERYLERSDVKHAPEARDRIAALRP